MRRKRSVSYLALPRTFGDRLRGRSRLRQPNLPGPQVSGLELVRDGSSRVAWFGSRLRPWGSWLLAGAIVPEGFERYARILHPAYAEGEGSVPWSGVAEWSGRALEAASFFGDIATRADGERWPGSGPLNGDLPEESCEGLAATLAGFTSTPQDGWFCLWEGWGDFQLGKEDRSALVDVAPGITDSGRRYLLYRGPVRSITLFRFFAGRFQPPSFWWPEDRSWFVGTEIEARSTYIGGSAALIEELLSSKDLEVLPAALDDPFDGTHEGQTIWR